ncbi:hypothetical protein HG263_06815 [Pseudoalteromonas sp. JBTF-M23]|uniref:Uncharacterized protein n=1 Tax=Pseudoalteromonas caenipelagi TaxID=2726988 RepID=A0A849VE89_9GAMM|nr:hypothetical protein [Pseudoalteromonas caenipelagi]NOU50254.1 hypothetical protein [Pseudoalteromonas caenipelagi]
MKTKQLVELNSAQVKKVIGAGGVSGGGGQVPPLVPNGPWKPIEPNSIYKPKKPF